MVFVLAGQAATVPTAPAINVVSVTNASVTIGLTAPSVEGVFGILGYDIYQSSDGGFFYKRIATVVDLPYIVSGLTSGQSYKFQARGVSAAGGAYRSAPSAPVTGATTGGGPPPPTRRIYADWGIAISPAQANTRPQDPPNTFIGIPNGGTVTGVYPNNVAHGGVVSNNGPVCSGVKYVTCRLNWGGVNGLDNGDGTYNWAYPDAMLAQARGLNVGIYFVILTRTFNVTAGGADQNPAPADLQSYCQVYTGSNNTGYQIYRWSPTVVARLYTFMLAMGARYNADPNLAGIGTQETATGGANGGAVSHGTGSYSVSLGTLGAFTGSDVYSSAGFTSALQMERRIVGTAFPNARELPFNNFVQGDSNAQQLIDMLSIATVAQQYGAMWTNPDLVTDQEPGNLIGTVYPTTQKYHNGSNGIAAPGLTCAAMQPAEWTAIGPAQTPRVNYPPGPLNPSLQDLYNMATASATYATSLSTGARDHSPTAPVSQRSPLKVDSILADYRPRTQFATSPNFDDLVPIIAAHPVLRAVTPNP